MVISIPREERAFSDVFQLIYRNPGLLRWLLENCLDPGNNYDPIEAIHGDAANPGLGPSSLGALNIEGWWYLVYRTCDGIGAKMILRFLATKFLEPDVADPTKLVVKSDQVINQFFDALPGADEEARHEAFRTQFQDFLQQQPNWWQASFAGIASRGVGPGTNTGWP